MQIKKLPDEHTEQKNYFKLINSMMNKHPELILTHSVPNGSLRNKIIGSKLKAEGVKSGVLDISIPIPKHGYNGLYIEMKRLVKSELSENQKFFLNYLNDLGYVAIVAKGAIQAFDYTKQYLAGYQLPVERYQIDKFKFNKKTGLSKQYQRSALERGYTN